MRNTRDDGPSDAAMERMAKRLTAAGALSSTLAARPEPRFAAYKLGVVALAAVGGLMLAWQATHGSSPLATSAPGAALSVDRGATETAQPTEDPPVAEGASGSNAATVSVDTLPSAPPPSAASASAAAFAKSIRGTGDKSSTASKASTSELELLQRAQTALASDPESALSITSEQARAYPSGEFAQEREVVAVEALSRLGRKDESLRRARALVERFPRTPYATRLELAVGRPL